VQQPSSFSDWKKIEAVELAEVSVTYLVAKVHGPHLLNMIMLDRVHGSARWLKK
jgi:hypothetical protein